MKGQLVIVRAYGGKALIRRIWDVEKNLVYILDEENYQKLSRGQKALEPIGFPKEDVFKYHPEIAKKLNDKIEWTSLEQWNI